MLRGLSSLLLLLMAIAAAAAANDSCPSQAAASSTQCLFYLQEAHKEEVCGRLATPERRRDVLRGLRMRHCREHVVEKALPPEAFDGGTACRRHFDALFDVDLLANRLSSSHTNLLTRYDCNQTYSIAHDCEDCKGAYRRWVCSSLVPHYTPSGRRVLPCLSVCEDVVQQCPYLVPDQTVAPGEAAHPTPQYGGEPTFLCLDPNIPETGQQRLRSSRGDPDCCYSHCGSPGRGGQPHPDRLYVCPHCPERPPGSLTASATLRTFDKVLLVWTGWVTFAQTARLLISLLSIVCENSVRTTMCWFFDKRRHSCL